MRAGFLILCVGLYCILQAVGFPFCAPRAYSVFFCLPPVCSCFLRVYGALCVLRTGGFFLVLQAMWFARRAADGGMRRPSSVTLWHLFFPLGAGRIWNRPRATAEHGHGAPYFCKGENTGTALRIFARERTRARRFVFLQGREHGRGALCFCKGENTGTALHIFARERTRARRSVCLQRERVRALCAAFVHTHGERICARARHSALMQSGKADVVRRARVREQGRFIEAVFFRMAAPQRLFEPEQVAAALGGLA